VGLNVWFYDVLKGFCPLEALVMSKLARGRMTTDKARWKEELG